jgi:hypothetical protein
MHKQLLIQKIRKIFFINKNQEKLFNALKKQKNNFSRKTECLLEIINIFC